MSVLNLTKNNSRMEGRLSELFYSKYSAPTGRIKAFILNPEYKTNAPSCMVRIWDSELGLSKMIADISYYIQKGAGVKIHFGENKVVFWETKKVNWSFYCSSEHPDFGKMSEENKKHYLTHSQWRKKYGDGVFIDVKDDMDSIRESWKIFVDSALNGIPILLDLSNLREAGKKTSSNTISTGIFGIETTDTGFIEVYNLLTRCIEDGSVGSVLHLLNGICKVLARGGTTIKKGGIVTTAIDNKNSDVEEYLNYPLSKILGGTKKGIRMSEDIVNDRPLKSLVIEKVNSESLMLEKIEAPDLYANVCMGIFLKNKASCLVSPVNAGQCQKPEELSIALCTVVEMLALIHYSWRDLAEARKDLYLPVEEDRQIAVGWLGWANFLKNQGVKYGQCVEAMKAVRLNKIAEYIEENNSSNRLSALEIAVELRKAYEESAKVARSFNLERVYSIEPNQRVYLDYKDVDGFTTCRNINPPYSRTQVRASEVYGDQITEHGEVETVIEVGHDTIQELWEEFQYLAESTGLAHAGSFDIHRKIDEEWFDDFMTRSPLKTTYYQMQESVNQDYLNKGVAMTAECDEDICVVCGEG